MVAVALMVTIIGEWSWWGWVVALTISVVLIGLLVAFILRTRRQRARDRAQQVSSAVVGVAGMSGTVLMPVSDWAGQVKLSNGDTWMARSTHGQRYAIGSIIVVESIEGATAVVNDGTRRRNDS
ncbi:NfeD family protein [Microbacterium sp. YY-01]|uniref:NfeD family protein n=1 Tax=Microbacterium sp. YY-01 TaxID=3421634 RepID=UPI003D17BB27